MTGQRWAYYYLGGLLAIAVLADLIVNDRPLVVAYSDELHLPAFCEGPCRENWRQADVTWAIWPLISHSAEAMDLSLPAYLPPFSSDGKGGYHILGTDRLGRDTAAGLVSGTRTAVLVGLGSLFIALVVGVPLGAVAGFFGNEGVRMPRYLAGSLIMGMVLGSAYALGSLWPLATTGFTFTLMTLLVVAATGCVAYVVLRALGSVSRWMRSVTTVPIDRIVQFLLEVSVSIPGMVILIVALSLIRRPTIWTLVLVIGLLGWTSLARFLRAEMIRIRALPYIAAARVSGVGELQLLFRHALPNAIGPVLVVAAFLVGSSILAEAVLSFLGVGVPAQQVTWGSILQQARMRPSAWWLAVFPGLMLTFTVLACNSLRTYRR